MILIVSIICIMIVNGDHAGAPPPPTPNKYAVYIWLSFAMQ